MTQLYFDEREESAREELKRADHLITVSLKHTRTCAVMLNGIKRLISAYETAFDEYLTYMRDKKKSFDIPASTQEKVIIIKTLLGKQIAPYLKVYNTLIKINKSQYCSMNEYRKHIQLRTIGKNPIQLDTNTLCEYLEETKEFVNLINQIRSK